MSPVPLLLLGVRHRDSAKNACLLKASQHPAGYLKTRPASALAAADPIFRAAKRLKEPGLPFESRYAASEWENRPFCEMTSHYRNADIEPGTECSRCLQLVVARYAWRARDKDIPVRLPTIRGHRQRNTWRAATRAQPHLVSMYRFAEQYLWLLASTPHRKDNCDQRVPRREMLRGRDGLGLTLSTDIPRAVAILFAVP